MKLWLVILWLLFSISASCQVQPGTYVLQDSLTMFDTWQSTNLHIDSNNTFRIEFRTAQSCFLWHNIFGRWTTEGDKLILEDRVTGSNSETRETVNRKTTYLIIGSDLIFSGQKTDNFVFVPKDKHFGNYRKKKF